MKQIWLILVDADEVDPDTAIVAADPLSQQALECQAEDMAIEDTLYALERALTDGHLPSDTYLKQVSPSAFCFELCVVCVMGQLKADTPWLLLYVQPNVVQLPQEDNNSQRYIQNVCYTAQCDALIVSGVL